VKFYDCSSAPSPRRVRIFLAEKGIAVPTEQVDLRNNQQLSAEFRALNPQCTVPFLLLEDGTGIAEGDAICRYFEETHPEPPLFGRDAKEKALVAMWEIRAMFDGFYAVAEAFRNRTPGLKNRALTGPRDFEQIPALVERGLARIGIFFATLDERLSETKFLASGHFSIADITALVAVDFAARLKLSPSGEQKNLTRWHAEVSARPSANA
jgi:glutathione S-transferase